VKAESDGVMYGLPGNRNTLTFDAIERNHGNRGGGKETEKNKRNEVLYVKRIYILTFTGKS
jgi:hypothetical protein